MDESIRYNLRNPAFCEDIGTSIINRMYPDGAANNVTGFPDFNPSDVKLNNGQPENDTYQNQKSRDKQKLKTILVGSGAIAAAWLGIKKGKTLFKFIKGMFQKKGNGIKDVGTQISDKTKGIGEKLRNSSKELGAKIKDGSKAAAKKTKGLFISLKNFFGKIVKRFKK